MTDWLVAEWHYPLMMALVHSLWQGFVIMTLVYTLMKSKRVSTPKNVFLINFTGLGLTAIGFIITFILFISEGPEPAITITHSLESNLIANVDIRTSKVLSLSIENVLSLVWLIGAIFFTLRMIFGLNNLRGYRNSSSEPHGVLKDVLEKLKSQLEIASEVTLRLSSRIAVPMVVGIFKPVILFPVAYVNQMEIREVESILIHELVHIKRNDFLFNLIQQFIKTFLFFNPAIWWMSTQMNKSREYCCDDVVERLMHSNKSYVKALYKIATHLHHSNPTSIALINKESILAMRVKRILTHSNDRITFRPVVGLIGLLFAMLISFSFQFDRSENQAEDEEINGQIEFTTQEGLYDASTEFDGVQSSELSNQNYGTSYPAPSTDKDALDRAVSEYSYLEKTLPIPIASNTPLPNPIHKISISQLPARIDTTPNQARIEELEELLEQKTEELEELAEKLSEQMEEDIEIELEKMEALSEKLEEMLEPKLEALEDELNEHDMERLEELAEELEERMEDYMEEWEEKIEEDVLEELEERIEDLTEELEDVMDEEESEDRSKVIERIRYEMQEAHKEMELEMAEFHKSHSAMMKDPEIKALQEEMNKIQKEHAKAYESHEAIWTEETKQIQQEIEALQREIERKVGTTSKEMTRQINQKSLEVAEIAEELEKERQKINDN